MHTVNRKIITVNSTLSGSKALVTSSVSIALDHFWDDFL